MQSERVFPPAGECKEHLSGYDLTTLLIRNGRQLNLKPSELLVFTALATYWNGKPVYPRITTLSDNTSLSEKAVRTALNGLISKGYIIKSKRGRNANVYNININAVKSTVQSGKSNRISAVKSTVPCNKSNHDKLNQQQIESEPPKAENVVSFKKSFNREVPEQVKQYLTLKGITNPAGYWHKALKDGYADDLINKANAEEERQERIRRNQELLRQQEIQKEQEREELKAELSKPLTEQWTKEQAINHIYALRNIIRKGHATGLALDLANAFNLNVEEIITSNQV